MPLLDSAQKVVHVTLHGTMFAGNEEWQTGFYMGSATQDAGAPTQGFADAVRDAWIPMWTSNTGFFSYLYKFTGVKVARLNKNGLYDLSVPIAESFPASEQAGGYPANALPPQCALVATLIGGSGKGLGGKGRMYLPGISPLPDNTGHILNTTCQRIASDLAAFFNTIDGSFDAPGHVINVSRGHKNLLGAGARNVSVNGVRVGNVYDTQRRRRNALAETYYPAVVNDA
jgi:hypothetical protein